MGGDGGEGCGGGEGGEGYVCVALMGLLVVQYLAVLEEGCWSSAGSVRASGGVV